MKLLLELDSLDTVFMAAELTELDELLDDFLGGPFENVRGEDGVTLKAFPLGLCDRPLCGVLPLGLCGLCLFPCHLHGSEFCFFMGGASAESNTRTLKGL